MENSKFEIRNSKSQMEWSSVSDRIRVLLVITRLELGGAQRVVLHTARNLDRERFTVALAWGPGDLLDDEAMTIPDLDRIPVD